MGDILVFAGEAPTRVLQLEARIAAGKALFNLEEFKFPLEQYELALELEPGNLEARAKKGDPTWAAAAVFGSRRVAKSGTARPPRGWRDLGAPRTSRKGRVDLEVAKTRPFV